MPFFVRNFKGSRPFCAGRFFTGFAVAYETQKLSSDGFELGRRISFCLDCFQSLDSLCEFPVLRFQLLIFSGQLSNGFRLLRELQIPWIGFRWRGVRHDARLTNLSILSLIPESKMGGYLPESLVLASLPGRLTRNQISYQQISYQLIV